MQDKAAHIISERQKKGALSSIKKKVKLPKNVLVKNHIEYWPCLNETQAKEFTEVLEELSTQPMLLKNISIGLESTLRHLKKSELKLLVITDELSPRWFAQHLVAMALHKNQNTQIVIVKNLKDITKKLLKVSSTVLGVRTDEFDKFLKKLGNHAEFIKHFCVVKASSEDVSIKKKKKGIEEFKEPSVVLLQKLSTSCREFEPMDIDTDEVDLPKETAGFISFSKFNDSSSNFHSKSTVASYRPIKIKKIVGNAKRKGKKS